MSISDIARPQPAERYDYQSVIDTLFKPITCRSKQLPSRLLLAPINTGFTVRGRPSYRLLRFHKERSSSAIGISMVGNVAVEPSGRTNDRTAVLRARDDIARFAVLARAIHRRGSLSGIQVASAPTDLAPTRRWGVPDVEAEGARLREIIAAYTDEELSVNLRNFVQSISLAKLAGYDVVQVHAAHGYLLSLLLHPYTNKRRGHFSLYDDWFEDFLSTLRAILGETLLSIRLSALTGLMPEKEEIEYFRTLLHRTAKTGVDIIDISAGFYTIERQLIYPGRQWAGPIYSRWLNVLTTGLPCLIAIAGRYTDLRTTTEPLPPNVLVAVGRALIADPHFATKTRNEEFDQINYCTLENRCHYFSRNRPALECGVNPSL